MGKGGFDASWLALREPVDHRSRARELLPDVRREGSGGRWSRVVDLGSGTGSNVRYLARHLPWATEWTVVDHDRGLLDRVEAPSPDHAVHRVEGDLADEGLEAVSGADLVTGSALLDLVSEEWLRKLRDRCVAHRCGALFALTYDGTMEWIEAPAAGRSASRTERSRSGSAAALGPSAYDSDDELVLTAVNEHQRSDKGIGTALGPAAAAVAHRLFAEAGYRSRLHPSPWLLSAGRDGALIDRLVRGWVDAAVAQEPDQEDRIRRWGARRMRDIGDGAAVRVGHLDLLALP